MIHYYKIILFLFLFFFIIYILNNNIEPFTENQTEIVIARYNENLDWLNKEPFNKYNYIVYNKGPNEAYLRTDKFKKNIKLNNVGRETHTYLTHIINNYDNQSFTDITIFVPGSLELENRYERSKRLFEEIPLVENTDLFACMYYGGSSFDRFKDFSIDKYLSSNNNNNTINPDDSMHLEGIRPYGKWYNELFGDNNTKSECFTQNSMFAITKETILKKPKSYYEKLISKVNTHHNHEAVHYFERSWETVFYPFTNFVHVK